jgi:hypothetical protein
VADLVDEFTEAARDGDVDDMRRCIAAGVDKDETHSSTVCSG